MESNIDAQKHLIWRISNIHSYHTFQYILHSSFNSSDDKKCNLEYLESISCTRPNIIQPLGLVLFLREDGFKLKDTFNLQKTGALHLGSNAAPPT